VSLLSQHGIVAAFLAGLVSFLSPCVFPLVPGYLSYIAGASIGEARTDEQVRRRVAAHATFFVLGFALIFVMLGAGASAVGALLHAHKLLLERSAGALLIVFGVVMTGLLPLPLLQRDWRLHVERGEPLLVRSWLIGLAFGAGWSPCIGPVLGAILSWAAVGATLTQGVLLLLVYALGLGVPFLLIGLLMDRASTVVRRINRYVGPISVASGVVLALTGVLILSGKLTQLAQYSPLINF
jgi:cytochrome c-type biogenesis protein